MGRRLKHHCLPESSKETGGGEGELCRKFTIAQIRSATRDFNERLHIGKGGFKDVYVCAIDNGRKTIVAIKRWKSGSDYGAAEFQAVVDLLHRLRHPNIVSSIGYCTDGGEMVLVDEYMSFRSLGEHLFKYFTCLSWSRRLKICIDVARALNYLHSGTSGQEVNVKCSHIFLDTEWAAKVALSSPDVFGLSTNKSDVYSFGGVLLEVLCRKLAKDIDIRFDTGEALGRREWDIARKLEQVMDPELRGQVSLKCLLDYAIIVRSCLDEHQEARITMAEVLFGLESVLALHEMSDHCSVPPYRTRLCCAGHLIPGTKIEENTRSSCC